MGKTPLPQDEALQPLNVKVPSEDMYFLQEELKPALGVSYNAEAMRQVLVQLRTWFRLPAYVVDRLKKDASAQKLHLLEYLQMLLHKRYEELMAQERERGPTPHPSPAKSSKR
jgi:predicted DNA binding CopG/RHH family protein